MISHESFLDIPLPVASFESLIADIDDTADHLPCIGLVVKDKNGKRIHTNICPNDLYEQFGPRETIPHILDLLCNSKLEGLVKPAGSPIDNEEYWKLKGQSF